VFDISTTDGRCDRYVNLFTVGWWDRQARGSAVNSRHNAMRYLCRKERVAYCLEQEILLSTCNLFLYC